MPEQVALLPRHAKHKTRQDVERPSRSFKKEIGQEHGNGKYAHKNCNQSPRTFQPWIVMRCSARHFPRTPEKTPPPRRTEMFLPQCGQYVNHKLVFSSQSLTHAKCLSLNRENVPRETSAQYQYRPDQIGSKMITNFTVVFDGPQGQLTALVHFKASNLILKRQRARSINRCRRQCLFERHTH